MRFTWRLAPIELPMPERSKSSRVAAAYQPRFSSPIMLAAGMRTSSKKTSLKLWRSAMLTSGRTLMPGRSMCIQKKEMPRCFGASGSVRAMKYMPSALWARLVQIFCPLITKSSPSRFARVCSEARSDPAPGSDQPWHHSNSSARIFGRCCCFCSSLPVRISVGPNIMTAMPSSPETVPMRSASSWLRMNCSGTLRPRPPYSTGQCGPSQPRSASALRQRWLACSEASEPAGSISGSSPGRSAIAAVSSMKSRTLTRNAA